MPQRDSDAPNVARSLRLVREQVLELKHIIVRQRFYLEEAMGLNEDLSAAADKLQGSIDSAQAAVQKHSDDQAQIIKDLQAQVAAGLSPAQAQALLVKLQGSQADIQATADSLATVATQPVTPTDPGETPVGIPKA